jgi:hypothetical protein
MVTAPVLAADVIDPLADRTSKPVPATELLKVVAAVPVKESPPTLRPLSTPTVITVVFAKLAISLEVVLPRAPGAAAGDQFVPVAQF